MFQCFIIFIFHLIIVRSADNDTRKENSAQSTKIFITLQCTNTSSSKPHLAMTSQLPVTFNKTILEGRIRLYRRNLVLRVSPDKQLNKTATFIDLGLSDDERQKLSRRLGTTRILMELSCTMGATKRITKVKQKMSSQSNGEVTEFIINKVNILDNSQIYKYKRDTEFRYKKLIKKIKDINRLRPKLRDKEISPIKDTHKRKRRIIPELSSEKKVLKHDNIFPVTKTRIRDSLKTSPLYQSSTKLTSPKTTSSKPTPSKLTSSKIASLIDMTYPMTSSSSKSAPTFDDISKVRDSIIILPTQTGGIRYYSLIVFSRNERTSESFSVIKTYPMSTTETYSEIKPTPIISNGDFQSTSYIVSSSTVNANYTVFWPAGENVEYENKRWGQVVFISLIVLGAFFGLLVMYVLFMAVRVHIMQKAEKRLQKRIVIHENSSAPLRSIGSDVVEDTQFSNDSIEIQKYCKRKSEGEDGEGNHDENVLVSTQCGIEKSDKELREVQTKFSTIQTDRDVNRGWSILRTEVERTRRGHEGDNLSTHLRDGGEEILLHTVNSGFSSSSRNLRRQNAIKRRNLERTRQHHCRGISIENNQAPKYELSETDVDSESESYFVPHSRKRLSKQKLAVNADHNEECSRYSYSSEGPNSRVRVASCPRDGARFCKQVISGLSTDSRRRAYSEHKKGITKQSCENPGTQRNYFCDADNSNPFENERVLYLAGKTNDLDSLSSTSESEDEISQIEDPESFGRFSSKKEPLKQVHSYDKNLTKEKEMRRTHHADHFSTDSLQEPYYETQYTDNLNFDKIHYQLCCDGLDPHALNRKSRSAELCYIPTHKVRRGSSPLLRTRKQDYGDYCADNNGIAKGNSGENASETDRKSSRKGLLSKQRHSQDQSAQNDAATCHDLGNINDEDRVSKNRVSEMYKHDSLSPPMSSGRRRGSSSPVQSHCYENHHEKFQTTDFQCNERENKDTNDSRGRRRGSSPVQAHVFDENGYKISRLFADMDYEIPRRRSDASDSYRNDNYAIRNSSSRRSSNLSASHSRKQRNGCRMFYESTGPVHQGIVGSCLQLHEGQSGSDNIARRRGLSPTMYFQDADELYGRCQSQIHAVSTGSIEAGLRQSSQFHPVQESGRVRALSPTEYSTDPCLLGRYLSPNPYTYQHSRGNSPKSSPNMHRKSSKHRLLSQLSLGERNNFLEIPEFPYDHQDEYDLHFRLSDTILSREGGRIDESSNYGRKGDAMVMMTMESHIVGNSVQPQLTIPSYRKTGSTRSLSSSGGYNSMREEEECSNIDREEGIGLPSLHEQHESQSNPKILGVSSKVSKDILEQGKEFSSKVIEKNDRDGLVFRRDSLVKCGDNINLPTLLIVRTAEHELTSHPDQASRKLKAQQRSASADYPRCKGPCQGRFSRSLTAPS